MKFTNETAKGLNMDGKGNYTCNNSGSIIAINVE
ncbi:hypothetical protein ABID14_001827 [Peptoniphilus olsenii]|uniref:Uncharacterized protein n=1 Tax=Peptoniphilus olsenii TaxID=411570 RepID=A0ABV2JEK0_9FIRM